MIAIAITLLALAAGIHLLIHVKQAGLGTLYKLLAWKVILISGLFIICLAVMGVRHMHHRHGCHASAQCCTGRSEGACPYMKGANCCEGKAESCTKGGEGKTACCTKGGEEKTGCCKDMKDAKGTCTEKSGEAKAACCQKMAKDSTAKK